jgi:hypothetical protein
MIRAMIEAVGWEYFEGEKNALFLAASQQLAELGYDERFRRLWEMYFAIAEAGFREARLRDLQLVYAKPAWPGASSDAVPMSRFRDHERVG